MPLETNITTEANNRQRIAIGGNLDSNTAPELQHNIDAELNDSSNPVIIDFKTLDFISSAGLRVIFKTKKSVEGRNAKLLLVNLQPQIKKVFEIIKALDGMNVFQNQDEMDEYLEAMQNKVLDEG